MSNAFDTATDANAAPPLPAAPAQPKKSLDDLTGSDAQYDAITKADLSLTKQKIGAEAGMEAQRKRSDDAYAQRQERLIAAEGATMDDIKPWNAEKELNDRKTNLWEQFGSPGFVIAMLASSFSGTPMNSALNAGAAAMNAINEGDMDKYHKAFDAWKENSNLTLKRLDLEEHQFGQIENLRTKNMESWRASAASLAARFNDKRLQILLENGMDAQALEAIDARAKSRVELSDATQRLQDNETRRKITMALLGDSKDPKKLAQAASDAETIMASPKTPEQMAVANVISQPGFRDLSSEDQNKQINNAIAGVSSARYGGHVAVATSEANRRISEYDQTHKDASPEERDAAHLKILSEVSSANKPASAGSASAASIPEVLQQWTDARGSPPTPEMAAIIKSAYSTKGGVGGARIAQIGTALAEIRDRLTKGETLDDAEQEKILRAAVQQAPTGMTLDKESADLIAEQYLAGDRQAAAGFARSAQNMSMIRKSISEKAKAQGLSGPDIAMRIAEFHGIVSAETATGRRTATIGMFANEARRVIDVAKRASKDVPRGEFIPFNRAMLAFEKNTGDPKVVALGAALNAVINTYAKAINGGQQGTVSDKDHAREILELAYSDNQMDAVYNILEQELQAAIDAPGDVKQSLRDLQSGKVKPAPGDPSIIRYDANGNRVQ